MLRLLDTYLNRITMYRLVLYVLLVLLGAAAFAGFLGKIQYTPQSIILSALLITAICYATNKLFSTIFNAPTNVESVYITALILCLIIPPLQSPHSLAMIGWASVWSMASKYIFAIHKKHLFNPVAIAVVLTSFGFGASANWWVGNAYLVAVVIIGGLLIIRKTQREDMVFSFFVTAFIVVIAFAFSRGSNLTVTINNILLHSSLFFFAFIMLTEPLTTPPTKKLQIIYGGLVGFLFAPQLHFGSVYSTPELALIVGNVFSYVVSPKQKLVLLLKEKIQASSDIIDFTFPKAASFSFRPGQYMEWTLQHPRTDSRGARRYFTLASSPTENTVRLGVRFYPEGSSYKKSLISLSRETPIIASQLAGDFVLPDDKTHKLAFLAGGIGITPFRSMIKFLTDTKEKRDIVLLYSNKSADEIVYRDVFDEARGFGIRTVYTLTDSQKIPLDWQGGRGRVDEKMIVKEVPDFKDRYFYLSGPQAMVQSFEDVLSKLGVSSAHVKKDFFPGFV